MLQEILTTERCKRLGCGGNVIIKGDEYGGIIKECLMCSREEYYIIAMPILKKKVDNDVLSTVALLKR